MASKYYSNPYRALVASGLKIENHQSDLYVQATADARRIVKDSGWYHTFFLSNIDGKVWIEIPFAFEPFWEKRASRDSALAHMMQNGGTNNV